MSFQIREQSLWVDDLQVADLCRQFSPPFYLYSHRKLIQNYQEFKQAFGNRQHQVCFAVKANPNLSILRALAQAGSGFDIVSGGELARVLEIGGDVSKVVFSGVGKSSKEIELALQAGIKCFNVESASEFSRIQEIAQKLNKIAPIALRINPNIDAFTHPYISTGLSENKFGINWEEGFKLYQVAHKSPHLHIVGIDCHIGSQIIEIAPFKLAVKKMVAMVEQLQSIGIELSLVNFGGGLGVSYDGKKVSSREKYVQTLLMGTKNIAHLEIVIEMGRSICADAGILVAEVEYIKSQNSKNFAIVNSGMHHLLRPALYNAQMPIVNISPSDEPLREYDVVGVICESSDYWGKNISLSVKEGDYLAVLMAGAYGSSMASTYNSHPLPLELIVENNQCRVIRQSLNYASLWQGEEF